MALEDTTPECFLVVKHENNWHLPTDPLASELVKNFCYKQMNFMQDFKIYAHRHKSYESAYQRMNWKK